MSDPALSSDGAEPAQIAASGRRSGRSLRGGGWAHGFALGAVLLCFALAIVAVHPFANLLYGGDDFAYAWSAQRMVLDGKLIASSWVAASSVPQIFWGSAFCKVFGLSFHVLNTSTLVLSLAGPILVYLLGIELGLRVKHAALVSFFATINPLYLAFANSFMSDAYYAVLMLASLLAYTRGLLRQRRGLLVLGSAIASVALLQRQIGIATPAAVVGSLLLAALSKRCSFRRAASDAVAAAFLPVLCAGIFRKFPDAFGGTTITQLVKLNSNAVWARFKDVAESLSNAYTTSLYIAVLMLPLVVALLPSFAQSLRAISSRSARWIAGALVASGLTAWAFALAGRLDIWVPGEFLHALALPLSGLSLWKALALAGSVASPLLALTFVIRTKRSLFAERGAVKAVPPDDAVLAHVLLALTLAFHVFLVATFISFFNNYFLPLIPLALLLAGTLLRRSGPSEARWLWLLAGAAALFAFAWSTLTLEPMFRYVEADERLTQQMIASGIRSAQIFDYPGGYGRRNYDLTDAAVLKDPWGAFPRLRGRARYVIVALGARVPKGFPKLVQTETYRTLVGERTLEVYGRSRGKP